MTKSEQKLYQCTKSSEAFTYVVFASERILADLPDDRLFNFCSSMRVVPPGFFTMMITISVIKLEKVSNHTQIIKLS